MSHASGHVLRLRAFAHRIPTVPKISIRKRESDIHNVCDTVKQVVKFESVHLEVSFL